MCLQPITIGNPTRRFTDGLSRYRMQVKCNTCRDCIKQQQDDWFVRAFFEYQRVKNAGGDAWFVLLTYNDDNLPIYEDTEYDFRIPCFSGEDLKHFRDTFRVLLKRKYYHKFGVELGVPTKYDEKNDAVVLDWDTYIEQHEEPKPSKRALKKEINAKANAQIKDIRFMFCPEYGDDYGRSHYHALIFVPFKIPFEWLWGMPESEEFNMQDPRVADGLLYKAWKKGYVSFSKDHGARIESEAGIQYAMKYTTKDCRWYEKYGVDAYKKMLKRFADQDPDNEEAQNKYKDFCKKLPRRYQSIHFGVDGVNYYKNEDGTFNLDKCVDGRINLAECGYVADPDKPQFLYNMPLYYIRKIFYNQDEYKLWQKSEFGLQVASLRFVISQRRKVEKYAIYTQTYEAFRAHLQGEDITAIINEYGLNNDYELFLHLQNFLNHRSAGDLAMYDTVYRGISPDASWFEAVDGLSVEDALQFLRDNQLDFMLAQQHLDREPDPEKQARKVTDPYFYKPHQEFSALPCFRDFDHAITLIERIESVLGASTNLAWQIEEAAIAENYEVKAKRKKKHPSCSCHTQHIYRPFKFSQL